MIELQKLSAAACLTPRDKADVLVRAHKLVVDGLSALPPIHLRPEGEPYLSPRADLNDGPDVVVSSEDATPAATLTVDPFDRSRPSRSHPLSLSPVAEKSDRAPNVTPSEVPSLVLPTTSDVSQDEPDTDPIHQAMSESVMTITPELSREASASSQPEATEHSPPSYSHETAGTSGADLLLPIIIYAVVKSNPPQLASQLMYLRRYRSAINLTGEASYAIVNLTAVVEFLEHVELSELGLGKDEGRVMRFVSAYRILLMMSVADLSPIGLHYLEDSVDAASIASASSRLRGRVFQVGELAGTANKAITGVFDSSLSALKGFMPTMPTIPTMSTLTSAPVEVEAESATRPGMRARQTSGFSLANVTASVANIAAAATTAAVSARHTRSRASSRASATEHVWAGNQELVEVLSRPESIREAPDSDGDEEDNEDGDVHYERERRKSDARSVKSVSSTKRAERESVGSRLASIGVLGRGPNASVGDSESPVKVSQLDCPDTHDQPGAVSSLNTSRQNRGRGTSLLGGGERSSKTDVHSPSPIASPAPPATPDAIDPPIERFMSCEVGDIRLSEIGVLLRDYRRLGEAVQSFHARHTDI